MTETTTTKRDGVMRKIQSLLDKAASTTFPAERDALLAKADELMVREAIEEAELASRSRGRKVGATKPEVREMVVPNAGNYEASSDLLSMFTRLARHLGVKLAPTYKFQDGARLIRAVGYPSDLDYLSMLFLNLQMHFLSSIEPKRDPALTDVENFATMWEAGMDYDRIWKEMDWDRTTKKPKTVRAEYHRLCEAQGREPIKGLKAETYQRSFLRGYTRRIDTRLEEMRRSREEAAKGHEVVLAGRSGDLDEFYWDLFPDLRPHPSDCDCDRCHYLACNDPKCKRTPQCVEYNKQRNKPVRYRAPKQERVNAAAMSRGRSVADEADLGSGKVANKKEELR